ncbi:MAG: hypothetical protein AAGC97_15370 [Planctomycetota bacterium]
MLTSVRDYFVSLGVLLAVMVGYQATVTRLVTPPAVHHAEIAERVLTADDRSIADLFSPQAWERGKAIRLMTDDGMLLFRNHEQIDDGEGKTWKFWPITIVLGRGLSPQPDEEPILIQAAAGAQIEFDAALDLTSGVAPSIHRGSMIGSVEIQRVRPTDAAFDPSRVLNIRTSDVGVDRRKIWTTQPIHMEVGRAVLVGRDLTLHLAASTTSDQSGRKVTDSLDRMELVYLRDVTFPVGRTGIDGQQEGRVEVHCEGAIDYDFALDQLSLHRDVNMLHFANQNDADWTDRFECESLVMTLRDPMNSALPRRTMLDWMDAVVATGMPVRATIQSQSLDLVAGRISLDPIKGRLRAEPVSVLSRVTGSPSRQRQDILEGFQRTGSSLDPDSPLMNRVVIRHGDLQATLANVDYQFDPGAPKDLGILQVIGSGEVADLSEGRVMDACQWGELLEIKPLESISPTQLDAEFAVRCEGGLRGRLADGGSFVAGRVQGVMRTAPDPVSRTGGTLNARLFPDRFVIEDDVQVHSQSLHAATNVLHLFFEDGPSSPKKPMRGAASSESIHTWVRQPDSSSPDGARTSASRPPATIQGNQVAAKLRLHRGELTSTSLSVDGDVRVSYPIDPGAGAPYTGKGNPSETATLRGDQLLLRDGGLQDVIELRAPQSGQARLDWGDGYFIGPEIRIRPDDNFAEIPGAGQFRIPSSMFTRGAGRDESPDLTFVRPPVCTFGGSMSFEGQDIRLTGGVQMDATVSRNSEPSEIRMRGDQLMVRLTEPVQLSDRSALQSATIDELRLSQTGSDSVSIDMDLFASDGLRTSRHQLVTNEISWFPGQGQPRGSTDDDRDAFLAGQIVAPGPGSYHAWLRSSAGDPFGESEPPDSSTPPSNRGAAYSDRLIEQDRTVPPTITALHLIYVGGMRADLPARTLRFVQNVRVARQPVPDFESPIQAHEMDLLSSGQMTLDCQELRLAMDPAASLRPERQLGADLPMQWEIDARGGIRFRNRTEKGLIEATAARCGYAARKDLFTMEGVPDQPARLWQTDPLGKPLVHVAFRHVTMQLETMDILSSQMESIQMGAIPRSGTK